MIANGDGSRLPTEKELDIAQTQGVNFANLLNAYHRGLTPDTSGTKSTHKEIKTSDAPTADAAPPAPVESTGEPTAATTAITDAGDHQAEPTAERSAEATEKKASAVKAKKEEKKSKCFCM